MKVVAVHDVSAFVDAARVCPATLAVVVHCLESRACRPDARVMRLLGENAPKHARISALLVCLVEGDESNARILATCGFVHLIGALLRSRVVDAERIVVAVCQAQPSTGYKLRLCDALITIASSDAFSAARAVVDCDAQSAVEFASLGLISRAVAAMETSQPARQFLASAFFVSSTPPGGVKWGKM